MIVKRFLYVIALCLCFVFFSCSFASLNQKKTNEQDRLEDTRLGMSKIKYDGILDVKSNSLLILEERMDLCGRSFIIPEGVTIKSKGGFFCNGHLIGNNTKIEGNGCIFENVKISGEWNVPEISTSMFKDLTEVNSLQSVIALASSNCRNHIIIEKGVYHVAAHQSRGALTIPSNTSIELEGEIYLEANEYSRCYVVNISNAENVTITGRGLICGDKNEHKGRDGEWGHGVYIAASKNVTISNITVENCWGDCLYIGANSRNIIIKNCLVDGGRRQGISVTSAVGVKIENCTITNVSGCKPGFGIDIEPNKNCIVDDIFIKNVRIDNCYGGITTGSPETGHIGLIDIDNCTVAGTKNKWPVVLRRAKKITIMNSNVESDDRIAIMVIKVDDIKLKDNTVKSNHKNPISLNSTKKEQLKGNTISRMR